MIHIQLITRRGAVIKIIHSSYEFQIFIFVLDVGPIADIREVAYPANSWVSR